ncbi:type II secretion system F family protein [Patescibacteria group bacterium]|nr:type II secretion system F family protein [Patescibacteria group bacterium]
MPRYFYEAKSLEGKEESGSLVAKSEHQLARALRRKGYFLISARIEGEEKKEKFKLEKLNIFEKLIGVSFQEKLFFTRNLEVMVRTGVPLPRAFEILATQAKSKKFKEALRKISEKIIKGESISTSLSSFPTIFSTLFRETLKVGEETGRLEDSLKVLALEMEREYTLRSRVKTAMIYPLVVLCTTFGIGILMMIVAVPQLKAAFEELNVELPFSTRMILGGADFLTKKWWLALLIIFGLASVVVMSLRTKKGGKFRDKMILKIPVISKIVRQTNSTLCLRILGSLLKAGVPIVRALEVASGALTNFYFKKSLLEAAKTIKKGGKLSQALSPYEEIYSPMVLQMMEIGEETGETSEVLEKLADFYEEELAEATKKLSSIIEPVLILIIGGIVGFFAVSMMQPMFGIMGGM